MAEQVGGIYYDVSLETGQMVRGQREVQRELGRTTGALDNFSGKLTAVARGIAVYAVALAMVKAANVADEVRLLASRMEVAAGSTQLATSALSELQAISIKTQASLAANVQVFTRLNQSILQMGGTQADTLRVTDLLAKAVKVSGANAQESAAAMQQFGQALGSGRLQGDELRSLAENAPYLMRQLAESLGVPVGALRKLGEDGKLTADVVTNALSQAAERINADFEKLGPTLAGAFTVTKDAAGRLVTSLDGVTQNSAALTGVTQGLGQVFDALAGQIGGANSEAEKLARGQAVKTWAEQTREVLSYVVDAADVTWQAISVLGRNVYFALESSGRFMAAVGAVYTEVLRGNISGARQIGAELDAQITASRAKLDAADQKTLAARKTWGEQMRDAWAQARVEDRGFTPTAAPGKLTTPGDPDAAKKAAAEAKKAADARLKAELEGLAGEERIKAEQDALTQKFYADEQRKADKAAEDERRREIERQRNLATAQDVIAGGDPIARLELELQRKSAMLAEAAALDLENARVYSEAQVSLERDTQSKITAILMQQQFDRMAAQSQLLGATAGLFGGMADLAKQFAGEQSGTFRALFVLSKGFAIADAGLKLNMAILQAMADPTALTPAQKLANYAAIASAGTAVISSIAGINFGGGRQYGGPTSAGSMYRVNEGGRPEMFTASNGNQYMLPTKDGRVTPAGQVGGGAPTIVINNMGAPVQVQQQSFDQQSNTMTLTLAEAASQISERRGPLWGALSGSTNLQPRNNG